MKYLGTIARALVTAGLFSIFIKFFCSPSYSHYQERQTFLAESSRQYEDGMLPAISIWSQPHDVALLYQNIQDSEDSCYNMKDFPQLVRCLETYTANLSSLLKHVGREEQQLTFNVSGSWRQSYGILMKGRVYTLDTDYSLSHHSYTEFTFKSPAKGRLSLEIHEPHFTMDHTERSEGFQSVRLELEEGNVYTLQLEVGELSLRDKQNRRCQPDTGYSFRSCITVNTPNRANRSL